MLHEVRQKPKLLWQYVPGMDQGKTPDYKTFAYCSDQSYPVIMDMPAQVIHTKVSTWNLYPNDIYSLGCQSQKMRNYGISCWCVECPDCECNISENNFLGFGHFNYEVECLRNCMDTPGCKYYTWYGRDNSQFQNQCFLFSSCESTTQCKGCYRGARKCFEMDMH